MINPVRPNLSSSQATPASDWRARVLAAVSQRPTAAAPPPSAWLTLGDGTLPDDPTYGAPGNDPTKAYSNDALTALLERNANAGTASGRFAGLGKALLSRLGAEDADVSLSAAPPAAIDGLAAPIAGPTSDASLSVRAAGGAIVKVTLHRGEDGLSIDMKSDGTLSDDERQAVAKLAGSFQDALDGLGTQPPTLALDGLTRGAPLLASVDFEASIDDGRGKPQTIAFHAGDDARNLKVDGPSGTLDVDMDMTSPASWGSQDQRQASVANYLARIDDAADRGHGDRALVSMFKAAVSQMNAYYPPTPAIASSGGPRLSQADHAVLTGLADFSASLSQSATAPNPLKSTELDTFSYRLAQQTRLGGPNDATRTIEQQQSARLTASYHQALTPDTALQLTDDPTSQNYTYRQIDDTSRSDVRVAYDKGRLVQALVTRSASQSTHEIRYVLGRLVDDVTTPSRQSRSDDLRKLIAATPQPDGRTGPSPQALAQAHAEIALQSEPYRLARSSSA